MSADSSMQPQRGVAAEAGAHDVRRLVVSNQVSELRRVSDWLHDAATAAKLTPELSHALELAVNEALANIISYAYMDDGRHEIAIELRAAPDAVQVAVEDDGVPFNPLDLTLQEHAVNLERSRPTGRGIPLMRNLIDDLRYARRGKTNILTMVMRLKK